MRNKRQIKRRTSNPNQLSSDTDHNEPDASQIVTTPVTMPSISDQIKAKSESQSFYEAFEEFSGPLQANDGQVLFEEFEALTGFKNLESKVAQLFVRASVHFKIAVISELEDDQHIQTVRELERILCKSSDLMLEVTK